MSRKAPAGRRIGWDFAGTVTQAAADGTGPKPGARVTGMLRTGAWAEQINVPTNQFAEIPDNVTFAQASTLPVAGLTALHCLIKGGFLLERPRPDYGRDGRRGRLRDPTGETGWSESRGACPQFGTGSVCA